MAERISAQEVRRKVESDEVMLVCAYDDKAKCEQTGVEPSIPFPDFRNRLDATPKTKELVFFCA